MVNGIFAAAKTPGGVRQAVLPKTPHARIVAAIEENVPSQ